MRVAAFLLATTLASRALADEPPKDPIGPLTIALPLDGLTFTPNVQYKLRYRHFEGRDFTENAAYDFFRHRARIGAELDYDEGVGVFVQLQDVRGFGTDTVATFGPPSTSLHQGYARIRPFTELELRAGRQEIAYENHRLIGNLDWLEEARAFDAIRLSFDGGIVRVDSFFAKTADLGATPTVGMFRDGDVLAGNLHVAALRELEIGLVGVIDRGMAVLNDGTRGTFGGLVTGQSDVGISYSLEGYGQVGQGRDLEHRAYMAGASIRYDGTAPWRPFLSFYGEYLSGAEDKRADASRTFQYPYPTGHKFHGEMDFFLNMPVDTDQRGLLDVNGTFGMSPVEGLVVASAYHWFASAVDRGDGRLTFGHEVDLKASYRPWRLLTVDLVYGLLAPGDIWQATRGDDLEHFAYSTIDARF